MKLYQTRDVINRVPLPNGNPGAARCFFPSKRLGTLVWTPVLEIQLVGAAVGDIIDVDAGCTMSSKVFVKHGSSGRPVTDSHGNPLYGSAFVRCELLLSPQPQARPYTVADRCVGLQIGLGSGENVCETDNRRPYYQPTRNGKAALPWPEPWLTLLIAVSSGDAREGKPVSPDYLEACAEHPEGPAADDEYAFMDATVTQ